LEQLFLIAAAWLGLAIVAAILAYHLRISLALVEICVGVAVAGVVHYVYGTGVAGANDEWLRFLASSGAILLTFLAGSELDGEVMRKKTREVAIVGGVGFMAPFLGCAAVAFFILDWGLRASLLCGIALSTTSMAVVYAVMLETGFNRTEFGKGILGACFINDLGTVVALSIIFAPFTYKSIVFVVATVLVLAMLPFLAKLVTDKYARRTAAIRTKFILFVLFGLGFLALWSGNEAVLPAYIVGMVLAGQASGDEGGIKRLRTLTVGLLTPFYFLRAGTLVSLHALILAPFVFLILLSGKVLSKIVGLFPVISRFRAEKNERWYYTLMMSTGLTFGTISALFGYTHGIVTQEQYSFLVATVIASAVIPTLIAGKFFTPRHLLPGNGIPEGGSVAVDSLADEG
jgi:Kef-type K+ transport system membrane component KefB